MRPIVNHEPANLKWKIEKALSRVEKVSLKTEIDLCAFVIYVKLNTES